MKFDPKKEEDLSTAMLSKGNYPFKVVGAEERQSQAGNDMIVLTLKIEGRILTDYLLEAFDYKIRHFAYGVGLQEKYDSGEFSAKDCLNKTGMCTVGIQKEKYDEKKDKTYPAKNVVDDYCVGGLDDYVEKRKNAFAKEGNGVNQMNRMPPNSDLPFNDDIPF